jgi:hypothetical protein
VDKQTAATLGFFAGATLHGVLIGIIGVTNRNLVLAVSAMFATIGFVVLAVNQL